MTYEWKGDEITRAAEQAKTKALETAAVLVEGQAILLAPIDTGNLRSSITHRVEGDEARIGTNVIYAPYVCYGTSKMAAQPYLRPALDENIENIKRIISDIIGKRLEGGG